MIRRGARPDEGMVEPTRPATSETPTTQSGVGGTAICGSITYRGRIRRLRGTSASGSEAIDSMGPSDAVLGQIVERRPRRAPPAPTWRRYRSACCTACDGPPMSTQASAGPPYSTTAVVDPVGAQIAYQLLRHIADPGSGRQLAGQVHAHRLGGAQPHRPAGEHLRDLDQQRDGQRSRRRRNWSRGHRRPPRTCPA